MTITFMSVSVVTCTQPPGSNSIRLETTLTIPFGTTSGEGRVKIDAERKKEKQFEKRSRCLLMNIFSNPPPPPQPPQTVFLWR